jgi:hypothetical protein
VRTINWYRGMHSAALGAWRNPSRSRTPSGRSIVGPPAGRRTAFAVGRTCAASAACLFLLTGLASAQDSQFFFDANGNLLVQATETGAPPQIIGQPQNRIVAPGEATSFFVVAADTRALTYQWRFSGTNIGGATNDALLRQNVSTNNEGEYRVVLTNPSGSVTSAPALLLIDSDADGLPDSWELAHFGNLTNSASADSDGDGSSNFQEFLNGTDPASSNSVRFLLTVVREGGSVIRVPDQSSYTNGQTVTLAVTASSNEIFHAWSGDILTRSNSVTLVMTNNKTLYARFTPMTFIWTNLASGDWNVANNWSPNLVPGTNDSVVIANNATVTLNTPADCADVALGSAGNIPTLTGSGTLKVRGNFAWTSGTMDGGGRTIIEAGANLSIANSGSVTLINRTLENGGTATWSGAGNFVFANLGVFTNRPGALFRVQNAASFIYSGGGFNARFDNAGTFRKSGNNVTTSFSSGVAFDNSGTVEIQTGTLSLGGGGTDSGSFSVPAGTALIFSGDTHTASASSSMTGAGQLTVSGGIANLAGLVNVSGSNTFSGGTANFTGNTICTNNTVTISGGTANFSSTGLVSPAIVSLSNGALGGSGTVTVLNAMNWTGGSLTDFGRLVISGGATLQIANPSDVFVGTHTLENGGTTIWSGAGRIIYQNSGVFTNRPGALFEVQNAATFLFSGGGFSGRFDNAGTFRKSANSAATTVGSGIAFNNSGTVEIQVGTLQLNSGGAHSGSFTVPLGTALVLSGDHNALGGSSITGAGQLTLTGGTSTFAGLVNVSGSNTFNAGSATFTGNTICTNNTVAISGGTANFSGTGLVSPAFVNLSGGALGGSGTVTVLNAMNWTGGSLADSGRLIISGAAALQIVNPSDVFAGTHTLENGGTTIWSGAGRIIYQNGGVITNRAGALFHVQNAATFFFSGGGFNGRFDNAGTFRKSASSGTATVAGGVSFNNSGTVDIRSGIFAANGGYVSSASALLNCSLGGTTAGTGFGQLQVAGTVTLNGSLSVDLANGFSPALNDSFTVLTAGTRNGTFTSFSYPSNQLTLQLSNTANSVIARVTGIAPPPPVLHIERTSPTAGRLYWSTNYPEFHLEYNTSLSTSNWAASGLTPEVQGTNYVTTNALSGGQKYYRLSRLPAPFTPPPPPLRIERVSSGAVRLLWPAEDDRICLLKSITNLSSPNWAAVLPAPAILGGTNAVTNAISGTREFYRLSNP